MRGVFHVPVCQSTLSEVCHWYRRRVERILCHPDRALWFQIVPGTRDERRARVHDFP